MLTVWADRALSAEVYSIKGGGQTARLSLPRP